MPILLSFILFLGMAGLAGGADISQPGQNGSIRGDVMYWEGDEVVVKEMSGRQVNVRVTPQTKMIGVISRLKTGDKIEAQINADGAAQSIQLQIPDAAPAPGAAPPAAR